MINLALRVGFEPTYHPITLFNGPLRTRRRYRSKKYIFILKYSKILSVCQENFGVTDGTRTRKTQIHNLVCLTNSTTITINWSRRGDSNPLKDFSDGLQNHCNCHYATSAYLFSLVVPEGIEPPTRRLYAVCSAN